MRAPGVISWGSRIFQTGLSASCATPSRIYGKVLKGPGRPRAAPSGLVPLRPLPVPTVDEKDHPEAPALAPFFSYTPSGCRSPGGLRAPSRP